MKKLLATIALAFAACALNGCVVGGPMVQPSETAGPALQSPYCAQHPNESRCLN